MSKSSAIAPSGLVAEQLIWYNQSDKSKYGKVTEWRSMNCVQFAEIIKDKDGMRIGASKMGKELATI